MWWGKAWPVLFDSGLIVAGLIVALLTISRLIIAWLRSSEAFPTFHKFSTRAAMHLTNEMRTEIESFFTSKGGAYVLSQLSEMRAANNDLSSVMNQVQGQENPDLALARQAGIVNGLDAALELINRLSNNGD